MLRENELSFFQDVLRNMQLPVQIAPADSDLLFHADMGLRRRLGVEEGAFHDWNRRIHGTLKKNVLFRITDEFACKYVAFFLNESEGEAKVVMVGPYVNDEIDRPWLERFCQRAGLHKDWLPELESYFKKVVYLKDESLLFAAVTALGDRLWGEDQFTTESIVAGVPEFWIPQTGVPDGPQNADVMQDIQRIESSYEAENRLIEAVSQGQSRKAELMLAHTSQFNLEQRTQEMLRNTKNYTIILNTLLRKAAEQGGVHPLYIDRLSSEFATRIEKLKRQDDISAFWQEMAHRYCLLVKKHSLKPYSPLIQKVISRVEFDLAGDLSLKANAKALNVNASYLSTLFKKELGMNLTEYVNGKRVEYAIYLLNTTKLSISMVGQRCGIQDDNYFTKIFKKYVGKTPKQFRQENALFPRRKPQEKENSGLQSSPES